MSGLVLDGVHKYYGDVHAVKGVSMSIETGEFVVLVGPSGCGKSTLLRAVAGLEAIDQGEVTLNGRRVTHLAPKDRNVAMVFQSYALYPYLTVYDNIAFGLRARKAPADTIDRQVRWAAELLHIDGHLKRLPKELSGGQRQRVAIGRAIVRDADLYLFDEPLSNLDAKLRDGMREEIKRLHQRLGKTFVYVTHDQIEAMTLAERIVLLDAGQVAQSGPPLTLFERPSNVFVAGFLGSPAMNFIPVTVADGGRLRLPDGQTLTLGAAHQTLALAPGRALLWGVRPEQFGAATDSTEDGETLDVTLDVVQPTGSRSYGSFALGETRAVAELDAHLTEPQTLRLAVARDRTVLFDPQTRQALVSPAERKGESP